MIIEKMIVKTGTECSLKCKKCGEFNPYLKTNGRAFSCNANVLIEYSNKILQAVDSIKNLQIAGGEAFLHKDLFEYIDYTYNHEKIGKIEVVTNGTIVPQANMLKSLSEKKIE